MLMYLVILMDLIKSHQCQHAIKSAMLPIALLHPSQNDLFLEYHNAQMAVAISTMHHGSAARSN